MTYAHLLDLADPGSFDRGREYAVAGRVSVRSTGPGGVAAVATGSQEYDLSLDENGGTCSCPMGMRDVFCKHLVALALVLDARVEPGEAEPGPEYAADGLMPATSAWLDGLDADRLRDVVRTLAEDADVADQLDRQAAVATGDVTTLWPLVDSLRCAATSTTTGPTSTARTPRGWSTRWRRWSRPPRPTPCCRCWRRGSTT